MKRIIALALLSTAAFTLSAMAQTPSTSQPAGTKQTVQATQDFPVGYVTTKTRTEYPKNVCNGKHSHPGIQIITVIEGEATVKAADGQSKTYKAGEVMNTDKPNTVHEMCSGPNGATLVTFNVTEKGKPAFMPVDTADAAKAMLAKAVAAVKADRDTALAQMLKGENEFRIGDIYPFCSDAKTGKTIVSPKAVPAGTDVKSLKNSTGKNFGQEIAAAGEKPEGTITEVKGYLFPKPDTTAPAFPKTSFVTRVGDLVCGAGYYPSAATN